MSAKIVSHAILILSLTLLLTLQPGVNSLRLGVVPVHADPTPAPGTTIETQWVPSGPASDQILITIYASQMFEYFALGALGIDLTDAPMNAAQPPTFCFAGSAWWCVGTPPNPPLPACPNGQAYAKGWINVVQDVNSCMSYPFSLLNMWNMGPADAGPTIRWGFSDGTGTLNPYLAIRPQEDNVLGEVYDTLIRVSPYDSRALAWMGNSYSFVTHTTDPNCPAAAVQCLKLNLRGDIYFHDGFQLTASDVKFSYLSLIATGAPVGACLAANNIFDVAYDPRVLPVPDGLEPPGASEILYVEFSAAPPLTWPLCVQTAPILPQHIWHTAGAAGPCSTTGTAQCGVDLNYLAVCPDPVFVAMACATAAGPIPPPELVGSGPFVCASGPLGAAGTVVGQGCTSSGTGFTTSLMPDTITLRRFGSGLTPVSLGYFRDNANYKQYLWADVNGDGLVNAQDISLTSGCIANFASNPAACSHLDGPSTILGCTPAGPCIGASSGGDGNGAVSALEKSQLLRWQGSFWNSPFSYSSLTGVLPAPPALQDDGSTYT